jgi:CDP-diacylglycerol--serine O-phosphatidyltransferase
MQAIHFDPHCLGWLYPIVMLVVAFLMVSTVHYPDFKGKGETIYLASKIAFVVIFAAILYVGREAILFAVLFAIFATYAAFGIINTLISRMTGK